MRTILDKCKALHFKVKFIKMHFFVFSVANTFTVCGKITWLSDRQICEYCGELIANHVAVSFLKVDYMSQFVSAASKWPKKSVIADMPAHTLKQLLVAVVTVCVRSPWRQSLLYEC